LKAEAAIDEFKKTNPKGTQDEQTAFIEEWNSNFDDLAKKTAQTLLEKNSQIFLGNKDELKGLGKPKNLGLKFPEAFQILTPLPKEQSA